MRRILIVDDDEMIRKHLHGMLDHTGFDVSESDNGHTGLVMLREKSFDAVFTDIHMPEMDGIELVRAIIQEKTVSRVIAMTGGSNFMNALFTIRVIKHFGVHGIIRKPLTHANVLYPLKDWLQTPSVGS
ncbi:MAG: response regulator [Magnetococcales bacterium]|nr:response regulator [Magnetococcales bacterium]